MEDTLANRVEICFGSFTATSTTLAAATSPTAAVKAPVTSDAPQQQQEVEDPPAQTLRHCLGNGARHRHDGGNPPDLQKSPALNARCVAPQDLSVDTQNRQEPTQARQAG
jgi:hypothetical protein